MQSAGEHPTEAEIDKDSRTDVRGKRSSQLDLGLVPRDAHAAQQRLVASSLNNQRRNKKGNPDMKSQTSS